MPEVRIRRLAADCKQWCGAEALANCHFGRGCESRRRTSARASSQFPAQRAALGKIERSVRETLFATRLPARDSRDYAARLENPIVLVCKSRPAAFRRCKERAQSAEIGFSAGIVCKQPNGSDSRAAESSRDLHATNRPPAVWIVLLLPSYEIVEREFHFAQPGLPECLVPPPTNPRQ